VIYNVYYECIEEFRMVFIGFFSILNTLIPVSAIGQALRSKVGVATSII
jgi:hypothetical protein